MVEKGLGTVIETGNVIKIGRLKYQVHAIQIGSGTVKYNKTPKFLNKGFNLTMAEDDNQEGTCKFCLLEETDSEDFLISPCECKGSCEKVHIGCLKEWLSQKVKRNFTNFAEYYSFKDFICELCKAPLPLSILKGGRSLELINISFPEENYMMLEKLEGKSEDAEDIDNDELMVIKFPLNGKKLSIGRSH